MRKGKMQRWCVLGVSVVLLLVSELSLTVRPSMAAQKIAVGVILDLNSPLGSMANNSISMALDHFYSQNPDYSTQIDLQVRDSRNDVVAAASAALDLIENGKVHAILGPQNSEQARFVVKLGEKAQVPVIWLPTTGPTLLPPPSPSSIHSGQNPNCFQFKAIAAIVEAFGWQSIIPIYEETEYGSDLIPCLTDAFKELDIRMINVSAIDSRPTDSVINKMLDELKGMQTRVFLVHMTMDLGKKFIFRAQRKAMMSEGYAWILTQELSSLTDPKIPRTITSKGKPTVLNFTLRGYMQGSLGVRPMDSNKTDERTGNETEFKFKFKSTLTRYGLWAYDTIQALAIAVEKADLVHSTFQKPNTIKDIRVDLSGIGMYGTAGQTLLDKIVDTDFTGLSGNFSLRQKRLEPSIVEVYNVVGQRERIIGYWNPERGIFQNDTGGDEPFRKYKLKEPLWPGDTMDKPPKLRIGVPRTSFFTELVNVEQHGPRLLTNGFSINVFLKVVDVLPFPFYYELVPLLMTHGAYDELLCRIENESLDAIIGDITIVANRTKCVDFTLPYLDSSVSMVVRVRRVSTSKLILFKPFNWLLWLILGGIFVGATIIVIMLEKIKDNDGGKTDGFVFNPFLVYRIDIKEGLSSDTAKWMVILMSFFFVIVVQVYTASLTSILTEGKSPEPSYKDENVIIRQNLSVGYQRGSWVRGLLIEQIGFPESQIKAYGSRDEYNDALSLGTKKGGVDAIFDETPYLNLFLSKYNSHFMMAGPIYKTGGFAFAFPKNSSLVTHFSKAILKVTQDIETFRVLKTKSSLPTTIDELDSEFKSDSKTPSLRITDFGGLFPVVLSVLALFFGLAIVDPSMIKWLREKLNFNFKCA